MARVKAFAQPALDAAFALRSKQERQQKLNEITAKVVAEFIPADADTLFANHVKDILFGLEAKTVREQILSGEPRIDGWLLETFPVFSSFG